MKRKFHPNLNAEAALTQRLDYIIELLEQISAALAVVDSSTVEEKPS
jgi:hypothetical protein